MSLGPCRLAPGTFCSECSLQHPCKVVRGKFCSVCNPSRPIYLTWSPYQTRDVDVWCVSSFVVNTHYEPPPRHHGDTTQSPEEDDDDLPELENTSCHPPRYAPPSLNEMKAEQEAIEVFDLWVKSRPPSLGTGIDEVD